MERTIRISKQSILFYVLLLLTILLVGISTEIIHKEATLIDQSSHLQHNTSPPKPLIKPTSTPNHHADERNNEKKIHLPALLRRLLSAENPIWTTSFRILTFSSSRIIKILYHPLFFLFKLSNHIIFWIWDQLIFPITFPIRFACWILVVKPIQILKRLLKKLKPLIVFLISGITFGTLIGVLGSFAHLSIANRWFPLYRKQKKIITQRLPQGLDSSEMSLVDHHNSSNTEDDNFSRSFHKNYHKSQENQDSGKRNQAANETKRETSENESDSGSLEEGEEDFTEGTEEDWPSEEELESHLTDSIESNKFGYSSAIQSFFNGPTKKRATSAFDQHHNSMHSPPSELSILNNCNSSELARPLARPYSNQRQIGITSPASKKNMAFKTD